MNSVTDAIFTLVVTAILAVIVFSSQPYLRLTYDAFDYIAASADAQTYLYGKNPDGFSYLLRPPAMPLFLYLFENKIFAGALLNIFAFGMTVFTSLKLGRLFIHDRVTNWIFIFSVIFSYSFLQLHFFLWTEAAFASIILAVFYCIIKKKPIYQVIALLTMAFLFRKAGGFITLAAIAVYIHERNIRNAVIISIAMASVYIGWEIFTFSQVGASASVGAWGHHITYARIPYMDSMTSWILPRGLPVVARVILLAGMLIMTILIGGATVVTYWRDQKARSLFLFWFVYVSTLFVFWGARDFDEADRYLAVVLPLFMLTCFALFSRLVSVQAHYGKLCFLAILWLIYPVTKCVYHLFAIHS